MGVIKKTVVLDDRLERFVRLTQSILVQHEPPIDATYSAAINFMLLATILETSRPAGLSADTREMLLDFLDDAATIDELNLHERMNAVRSALMQGEHAHDSKQGPRARKARSVDRIGRRARRAASDPARE